MKRPNPLIGEEQIPFIIRAGRAFVFALLLSVCIIVAVNNWDARPFANIPAWYVLMPAMVAIVAENAIKIWAKINPAAKIACYVFDMLLLLVITIFSDGTLISTLYIIILSEFYIEHEKLSDCIAMGASGIGMFLVTLAVTNSLKEGDINVVPVLTGAVNDLILLAAHFFVLNFAVQIYRKNRELNAALDELNETNAKLVRAYDELKEIAVLEERQRIAKDIHDTVGHAITAVIMQTEAARLVLDSDPEDARRKISTANMQAKNALEQLRDSVHLLSGAETGGTLKTLLETIAHDSADGTGIAVRTDIEDIGCGEEQRRFLGNSLKEGISNGFRHGGATAFWVEVKREGNTLRFLLSDNGEGSDPATLKEGFGLSGMRTRAEKLGGSVEFSTEKGEGFEIRISLPLAVKGEEKS